MHGRDDARHLLGGYASVAEFQARNQHRRWAGLSQAAFWVHQRQDAYNALINQRAPATDLERSGLDRSAAPADEYTWAKRTTCLNAEVVDFCLGPDAGSTERYHSISARLQEWDRCKPDVFKPVFFRDRDPSGGRFFPDICFLLDYCCEYLQHAGPTGMSLTELQHSICAILSLFLNDINDNF